MNFTMERKINKIIENYVIDFKDKIKTKVLEIENIQKDSANELLEFIYDFERLTLKKEDFTKRKRIKNAIPTINRCNAKRANGEQCTRKRKENCEFCGTHSKGTPHGSICDNQNSDMSNAHKLEVYAEDIQGIIYYVDKYNNVYKTEDVLKEKENPEIIGKYEKQNIELFFL